MQTHYTLIKISSERPALLRRIRRKQPLSPSRARVGDGWSASQNPKQIPVRIQIILLRCLNQAVDHGAGLGASRCIGKEPVLPAHDEWLYSGDVLSEQICSRVE